MSQISKKKKKNIEKKIELGELGSHPSLGWRQPRVILRYQGNIRLRRHFQAYFLSIILIFKWKNDIGNDSRLPFSASLFIT